MLMFDLLNMQYNFEIYLNAIFWMIYRLVKFDCQ